MKEYILAAVVVAAAVIALLGPRLIGWPRKRRLKKELKALYTDHRDRFPQARSMEELMRQTGASEEECYRLLREMGGRGVKLKDGRNGWEL